MLRSQEIIYSQEQYSLDSVKPSQTVNKICRLFKAHPFGFSWGFNRVLSMRFLTQIFSSIKLGTYCTGTKRRQFLIPQLIGLLLVELIQSILLYTGPSLIVIINQIIFNDWITISHGPIGLGTVTNALNWLNVIRVIGSFRTINIFQKFIKN